ncbi:MAG: DUF1731 domain-containing protein [Acidimicrobiia bacterium]|jgi:NAD dependent epimerase/dehydratase family enzyme|nr:DUF1731 domain-containing protein [Acidimicrobiia bacterium]
MRVVVPGGSGYLGQALTERLVARGDEVVVLTRGSSRHGDGWRSVRWDARTTGDWIEELEGADALVHLTGRRVDTRATRRNIDELISSRVEPVRAVGDAIRLCADPPPVWVHRFGMPAPALVARLGAPLLGSSGSLALTGRRVVPTRLLAEGFEFHQTEFESAARRAVEGSAHR